MKSFITFGPELLNIWRVIILSRVERIRNKLTSLCGYVHVDWLYRSLYYSRSTKTSFITKGMADKEMFFTQNS